MGLDLALGGLVLISAIRGWLKGFLVQAIRLAGLVASVYAAGPGARPGEAVCRRIPADDPARTRRPPALVGRGRSSRIS